MKKYILVMLALLMLLTGCKTTSKTYEDKEIIGRFKVVEELYNANFGFLYVVYEKDTKVMYYIWKGSYKGSITPIYNSDGSVKIYEGDSDD